MTLNPSLNTSLPLAERIRVHGRVQGVGFRPTVWRLAKGLGITGSVCNDAEGVDIMAFGSRAQLDALYVQVREQAPPLSRIDHMERHGQLPSQWVRWHADSLPVSFEIIDSQVGAMRTAVSPDFGICAECAQEIVNPLERRFRYPLAACTHCGPRFAFMLSAPFDRARTTLADYPLCADCLHEYTQPTDRRFHAQATACYGCGPRVRLERLDERPFALESVTFLDDCDAAGSLLAKGEIIAIKGLGGYQLACDATREDAVRKLRAIKQRDGKPLAMMAASIAQIRTYAQVSELEAQTLQSAARPIVLLQRARLGTVQSVVPPVAPSVAPGVNTLGFMLASSGLHTLLLRRMRRPIVLTSGNLSSEPQSVDVHELRLRFAAHPDITYVLDHDRVVARRVDDSVVQVVANAVRITRRARGHAPSGLCLPPGFEAAPAVLALGPELKNTFCLIARGQAVLSPHVGDLQNPATRKDYERALQDLPQFLGVTPTHLACDQHPDYFSSRLAPGMANALGEHCPLPIVECQHHHAHIAACLGDNQWPLAAGPVLGVVLDGIGYGANGELWGGEFMLADYARCERLACFKPVALLGGDLAAREPWRNLYAHLMAELKWPNLIMNFESLELVDYLKLKPRQVLDAALLQNINAPLASSCGRLFDAVAAALGLCRDHVNYEGEGAVQLEALVDHHALHHEDAQLAYPFAIPRLKSNGMPYIEPLGMWTALLGDLILNTPVGVMAARFHRGLAQVLAQMVDKLAQRHADLGVALNTVALSGGVFQNKVLTELVNDRLTAGGYTVLMHRETPCNDGGIAFGQALICAAQQLHQLGEITKEPLCV